MSFQEMINKKSNARITPIRDFTPLTADAELVAIQEGLIVTN